MWYENSYRRHLCDMHIEEWDDAFLSEFSPDTYIENLKKAKIQSAMIYFQSHVGYCYYPTKTGHMHKALTGREDLMKQLVDKCRQAGIFVTGYYSVIYNNWAHDTKPAWRMVDEKGQSARNGDSQVNLCCSDSSGRRYGMCCPNHAGYRQFVFEQMREMNDYFDFDGMFFDMLFWPHFCYCESCKDRWRTEIGGEIPQKGGCGEQEWQEHLKVRQRWMGEFANAITTEMKRLRPGISVVHNFATAVINDWNPCCAEEVNTACDYAGGDLYGGIIEQSFTCKFYYGISQNQPFEYQFSRCTPNLSAHTVTKSDDIIRTSVFLTAAHHGATLVIDAIDPVGTMDERVYEKIGRVFGEEIHYEKYLTGEMVADVGIYYSLKGKYNKDFEALSNHSCCVNTVRTLIENHITNTVTGGWDDITKYQLVVAPYLNDMDSYDTERLARYVENGGRLYFSGAENASLLQELIGAECERYTGESITYIAPEENAEDIFGWFNQKYPLPFSAPAPVVQTSEENEILARLTLPYTKQNEQRFASIHSNPPGRSTDIPIMVYTRYGKGVVIWSALPIENSREFEYKHIFMRLIKKLMEGKTFFLTSDAPGETELVVFQNTDEILIGVVQLNERYTALELDSFHISVQTSAAPKTVLLLPAEERVPFVYEKGVTTFETKRLKIYDLYQIRL